MVKLYFTFVNIILYKLIANINMARVSSTWITSIGFHENLNFTVLILYPFSYMDIINHVLYVMYSLNPTISVSSKLFTLILCFNNFPWMMQ